MQTNLLPFFVWDSDLDTALENIANGSVTEGDVVLSHFITKLEAGNPPDPRTMKFVLDAFKEILSTHYDGKKVDFASVFKMKYSKGRPPLTAKGQFERALQYGGEIEQLKQSGLLSKQAIQEVADKYGRTIKHMQEYYAIFNKIAGK